MLCRCVWQGAENAREATTLVRDLYDNLRVGYEIGMTYRPPTLDGELWRDFLTVYNSRRYSVTSYELWQYEESCVRQPTTYGEFSTRCGEFITRSKSQPNS